MLDAAVYYSSKMPNFSRCHFSTVWSMITDWSHAHLSKGAWSTPVGTATNKLSPLSSILGRENL